MTIANNKKQSVHFLEKREMKEYHDNGLLMYEATICVINPLFAHLFENKITAPDGSILIRVGTARRFWDNGQLNWELKYQDNGAISKDRLPSFRRDGSGIVY